MKLIKIIFLFFFISSIVSGCQSVKDGLEGKKRGNSSEQFLVEKKKPLVMPPDFDKLPSPSIIDKKKIISKEFDLEKSLGKVSGEKSEEVNSGIENSTLEKLIIKEINKN